MTDERAGSILVTMHEQEYAIVHALIPIAWADGSFEEQEKEMLEALLDAYQASEAQKSALREYAKEKRTLDDIDLQELSASDRRVLLQHAVLLSYADGHQHADETKIIADLGTKLRIPADEAKSIVADAEARAKKNLGMLG
ncbi:hypothetical protein AKJ09_08128 [Labilithrix luteola]|uniref:Uncharacterized protein n=1 Tax=Labilithrix luteola TaxID=1391654 RepID=A0A0K1Q7S7_9BACT|nr:TerB family tellurite resistance protein [Labilithrix luteola]AKV01465.1 hypothetical protein AKJ09_08128 [Labilithrix luteola]